MTWTTLTYAYGSVLTSTKMTQNQDNFTAVANGDSGAPKIQTAALQDALLTGAKFPVIASGSTYVYASNDREVQIAGTTPTIVKYFMVGFSGAVTIVFDLYSSSISYTVYGRIYVNGVATGTLRSTTTTASKTTFFTEAIPVSVGDRVQLFLYTASAGTSYNSVFRIQGNTIIPGMLGGTSNYDALTYD